MPHCDAYIICTSPRSGSTLLCRLLCDTGRAGQPESYFHRQSLTDWSAALGITIDPIATRQETQGSLFTAAIQRGQSPNGVFGLRMQHQSFAFFRQQLAGLHPCLDSEKDQVNATFGQTLFIHLKRASKLDQSISYVKAQQSGLWHKAPDGTEIERLSAPRHPVYNQHAIAKQLRAFKDMDHKWDQWFSQTGITPLRLTYEALSNAPFDTLNRVLAHLGLPPEPTQRPMPLAKLADTTSRTWAERFRAQTGLS